MILIELTCPAEENVHDAQKRKTKRYNDLVQDCDKNEWTVHLFTVEVGARGFVAHSFRTCLHKLGYTNSAIKEAKQQAERMALRCSYVLWNSRRNSHWQPWDMSDKSQADDTATSTAETHDHQSGQDWLDNNIDVQPTTDREAEVKAEVTHSDRATSVFKTQSTQNPTRSGTSQADAPAEHLQDSTDPSFWEDAHVLHDDGDAMNDDYEAKFQDDFEAAPPDWYG